MDHPIATPSRPISTPRPTDRYQGSALDPVQGGPSERLARACRHPLTAAVTGGVIGYLVMAAVLLGLGYVLTHYLASGSVGAWDDSVNRWFVNRRTSTLNSLTVIGSDLGATMTVVGVGVVIAIALAIGRRWRAVGFLAVGLVIEVTVFLTTAVVINRPRPSVPKLDVAPPTSSFPSGHTGAAVALYVGLAIILLIVTRNSPHRGAFALAACLLCVVPLIVATSRVYRGMHFATDVIAGALAGGLWMGIVVRTLLSHPAEIGDTTRRRL